MIAYTEDAIGGRPIIGVYLANHQGIDRWIPETWKEDGRWGDEDCGLDIKGYKP